MRQGTAQGTWGGLRIGLVTGAKVIPASSGFLAECAVRFGKPGEYRSILPGRLPG